MSVSNQSSVVNCTSLQSRTSFADYVQKVNGTTGFNDTQLNICKSEICDALWGDGNADISGIGMIVGYLLESILGFFFALSLAFGPLSKHDSASTINPVTSNYRTLFLDGCSTFFDCAIFLAFSIQISSVVVLVRKDWGINADGLGGLTIQITWAIALLCMLPLLYPLAVLEYGDKKHRERSSQVGEGKGQGGTTVITSEEYDAVSRLCLAGIQQITNAEQSVLKVFGAAGSIFISLVCVAYLLWVIIERHFENGAERLRLLFFSKLSEGRRRNTTTRILIIAIPILCIPLIWGVFRLRSIQQSLATNSDDSYTDNQWTFGQIVAATIFLPVLSEMIYSWLNIS